MRFDPSWGEGDFKVLRMSQRAGAHVKESPGSHAVYVSRPQAVADLIEQAASQATVAAR